MNKLAVALFLSLFFVGNAVADTLYFNTSDSQFLAGTDNQGWYNSNSSNNNDNDNYYTGASDTYRSFFSFDLSSLVDDVVAATFEVTRFYQGGTAPLSLWDVSTPADQINNNGVFTTAKWNDLGSGTSYGSYSVATGGSSDVLKFALNASALLDINNAAGGWFSIGAKTAANYSGVIFSSSGPEGTQRLVLTTREGDQEIPEPATLLLLGSGLLGLGAARRKKA